MKTCWTCGTEWPEKRTPGHSENCDECQSPWTACRNCRFYDDKTSQWCSEPSARDERPRDTENASRCCYFLLSDSDTEADDETSKKARADLEKLFGNATPKPQRSIKDIFEPSE